MKIIRGKTMGTYYVIQYIDEYHIKNIKQLHNEIDLLLIKINDQMSTYLQKSEISQFNQFKKINVPFLVSDSVIEIIKKSKKIYNLTNGALDISIGSIVNLWGFSSNERGNNFIPSKEMIKIHKNWSNMNNFFVYKNCLIKKKSQLCLDFSAIAKGYAVDLISKFFISQKIKNYIINIGGEIYISGFIKKNIPWNVQIFWPDKKKERYFVIESTKNIAIATSGTYLNFFKTKKDIYSHIIDPKTGFPISHNLISVTVIQDDCTTADGFATAFLVIGEDKAMKLANFLKIPIFMIIKVDNKLVVKYNFLFKKYLKLFSY
ncbi:MAG: FAD:protein FMN transferase [Arsenophonus sp.]|nr:MAG: FAD:protein FMN transferase [Arsenophonus sp.]